MRGFLKITAALLAGVVLYLLLWPVPVDPQAWEAPAAPAYEGPYEVNSKLAEFAALPLAGLSGPEAVISDQQGNLYATTHEGWILRWIAGQNDSERWVEPGGRPLGIAFDQQRNLWVANAYLGLQKIDRSGQIELVLSEVAGSPIRYADDVVVTPDGKVYFTDASTEFAPQDWGGTLAASLLDIMQHGGHGRVVVYDPKTQEASVLMDGLNFANGVTAAADGSFLLVAETGSYRVWKHWLKGDNAGSSEVLIDNVAGFPDNVHRGLDGRYWIGLTTKRTDILDQLSNQPFLRKVVQRLPAFMRPKVQAYGHIMAIDAEGNILASLQDPNGRYPATTGAWETRDYLYVSSLTAHVLARYDKSQLGLE